jgi:hypothetical protein
MSGAYGYCLLPIVGVALFYVALFVWMHKTIP